MHWLIAALVIGMIASGIYMVDADNSTKAVLYPLHKQFGVSLVPLVIARILLRVFTYIPPLPEKFPPIMGLAAKVAHYAMYLCMVTMPVSGYIMSNTSGKDIYWFTGVKLPKLVADNPQIASAAHEIHVYCGFLFLGLVVLHLLASMKHSVVDRVSILRRMWW